jgi:hypothetical protein
VIIQAHSDAELTDSQLDELANRLVNKRRELADMLDKLDLQIAAKDGGILIRRRTVRAIR